jgi:outer membrane immunogenic protein
MEFIMRRIATAIAALVVTCPAWAADLPPAPAPMPRAPAAYIPAAPMFSWTGFYIGGNLGGAWRSGNITDTAFGLNFSQGSTSSFIGGGQIGGNYQIGSFVIGAEAMFDWLANNNNSGPGVTVPTVPASVIRVSANDRWVTTLAARFGYAVDHFLIYGKGGGGWVGAGNFAVTNVGTGASVAISNSNTNSGWLAGAGVEYAFTQNWTARVEYDYLGLGNKSFTVPAGFFAPAVLAGDTFSTRNHNIQMLTVGVNYLFNGF